jgi:RimJ/RimL family protein N-acetyltransferase
MCEYLYNNNAKEIIMCPLKDNLKAINCYKKCGFIVEKEFTEKDTIGNNQKYLLMKKGE